jgi:hypothetical protein
MHVVTLSDAFFMSSVIIMTVVAVRLQPNYELDQKTFMKMHHLVQRDPKNQIKISIAFFAAAASERI